MSSPSRPAPRRPNPGRQTQGRGRGRGQPNRPQRQPPAKFKGNEADLLGQIFDCSDYKQADTFVNTLKRISEYIGAHYEHGGDIRSSILQGTTITLTIPTAPVFADPIAPTVAEQTLQLIFKGKIDVYIKRETMLQDNIQKAYSLILGQCTDLLQSKLKQQAQWAAISSSQDAIELIGLIKTITFKFEDQKFLPLALYQSKANLYSLRQGNMSNHDYLQRFQNLVDVATAYNGQLYDQAIIDIATERAHPGTQYSALSDPQQLAIQSASAELYHATMFIFQSDRRRYGKLSEEFENSFTKGNDDYPDNLVSAYHLINEYKCWKPPSSTPDPTGVAFSQKGAKGKQDKPKDDSWHKKATCHNCGKLGHIRPNCPKLSDSDDKDSDKADSSSSKSKEHDSADKSKKKTSFTQQRSNTTTITDSDDDGELETQFLNFGFCTTTKKPPNLRNLILLDNQSTVDLFCNRQLVSHVWDAKDSMTVHGNGGSLTTTTKAYVRNYGEVWFHKDAITNILALINVRDKFRVTYDSEGPGVFIVHKPTGPNLLFEMHRDGLHYHDTNNRQLSLVSTVSKQAEGFSKLQVLQAKKARDFQAAVGHPSTKDLKAIVQNNQIANCPVSPADIDRAETIYGPSVPILKGKTTRQAPHRVVSDYVAVPPEILSANKNVTLSGDIFFVNSVPFFATVSDHIKFTTSEQLKNRKLPQILTASTHVQAVYEARGFKIATMLMDREFVPMKHDLASAGIQLNTTAANEHVPKIERQIRVIKERVRATRHTLPFKLIPLLMLIELVYCSTLWINAFPPQRRRFPPLQPSQHHDRHTI